MNDSDADSPSYVCKQACMECFTLWRGRSDSVCPLCGEDDNTYDFHSAAFVFAQIDDAPVAFTKHKSWAPSQELQQQQERSE